MYKDYLLVSTEFKNETELTGFMINASDYGSITLKVMSALKFSLSFNIEGVLIL